MSKFNVGDKVRIRSTRGDGWNSEGEMDKWCGKVMTIREIIGCFYSMEEDKLEHNGMGWCWSEDDFVEKIETPKCKFKVGDYVIGNYNDYWVTNKGWIGRVVQINSNGTFNAKGKSLSGDEWTFEQLDVEHFDLYTKDQPTKIVITTDGKTTTAKMYRDKSVVKVETTKCHPDDRFDFMVGARVAFDRLVGCKKEEPETPKYYNGKVVCVNNCGFDEIYTTGKIYQFVDGVLTYDDGDTTLRMVSFKQWEATSSAKWLEVVE